MAQGKWRRLKRELVAYSFIAPNLIGFLAFTLIPVVFSLVISFSSWDYIQTFDKIQFVGLANYARMWSDSWFLASVRNNFVYAVATVPVTMALALVFAYLVDRFVRCKGLVRLMLYSTNIISTVVAAYVWQMMLSKRGLITMLLQTLGVGNVPIFLGDPAWAIWALVAMGVWGGLGYVFVLYMAGLQSIPQELYEACTMDGCSEVQRFRYITVPMLSPTTFFILITQLIFSFRIFTPVQLLTHGGPGTSTSMLAYYIYIQAFQYYQMGYSASITWVLFFVIFVFTLTQWKLQDRWVLY